MAFQDVHHVKWVEEDTTPFTTWTEDGRKLLYGFDRPLDNPVEANSRLAFLYRLATGPALRWYVEGATEYHTITHLIPELGKVGIALQNLKGNINQNKSSAAVRFRDMLREDIEHKRFSMISFDTDEQSNKEFLRKQIKEDRIVGFIAAHDPDFEFANFSIEELLEIACAKDQAERLNTHALKAGDWSGIHSGKEFERRYGKLSMSGKKLKGEQWGQLLAEFARRHPLRSDDQTERPILSQVRIALVTKDVNYDYQKETRTFDLETFALMKRDSAVF